MRILSIPGRRTTTPYIQMFCESLEDAGLEVVDVDSRDTLLFKFDVLHLHFPHFYIVEKNPLAASIWFLVFAFVFAASKILGKRIVYTVHDVIPFQIRNAWLIWPFLRMLHRAADGFVFLNLSSQSEFYRRNPIEVNKPFIMLGLASYPVPAPDPAIRKQRRREKFGETDALLVGFLGFRQGRKGFDCVAFLPERLASGRAIHLLVAGKVDDAFAEESKAILNRIPNHMVTLQNTAPSDAELNTLIQSLDIVLLPYKIGWNSSMAQLVLSNRARCICSDLPVFSDLEAVVGPPWVYTFSTGEDARESFVAAIERAGREEPMEADRYLLEQYIEANSFFRGAVKLTAFYHRLIGRPMQQVTAP